MSGATDPHAGDSSFRAALARERAEPNRTSAATPTANDEPAAPPDQITETGAVLVDVSVAEAGSVPLSTEKASPRGEFAKALRWLWKAPLLALAGLAALACIAVVLVLVLGLVTLAGGAVVGVPLIDGLVIILVVPAALALGSLGNRLPRAEPDPGDSIWYFRHRWRLVPFAVLVGGATYGLYRLVYVAAQNHPGGVLVAVVVTTASLVLIGWIADRRGHETRTVAVVPSVALLAALAIGVFAGDDARENGALNDYCRYGAVSNAQLQGCLDHVTTDRINELHTNAARFATGGLESCLGDSGPFCAAALTNRDAKAQLDQTP